LKAGTTRSGKSAEMNVSDHEYEVEHNKRNRPEIHRGGGRGKKNILLCLDLPSASM